MASARHAGPERQLDECDLQLINQLQIDGRLALGDLAETLGVHRNTAKARLDRLLKSRVLIPTVHLDPVYLGYLAPATIAVKVTPRQVNAIAHQVAALPSIQFVHVCTGAYDMFLSGGRFRSEEELYAFVTDQLSQVPGILSVETMRSMGLESFMLGPTTRRSRARASNTVAKAPGAPYSPEHPLDEQDSAIIRELQRDIRQPASALAAVLGMNRKSVAARLERLLGEGIAKPVMIADPGALGYRLGVILGVSVMPGMLTSVANGLKSLANLQYLVLCMGRYNMLAWCRCRDLDDLGRMITVDVAATPGIREVAASLVLREDKTPYPSVRVQPASGDDRAAAASVLSSRMMKG